MSRMMFLFLCENKGKKEISLMAEERCFKRVRSVFRCFNEWNTWSEIEIDRYRDREIKIKRDRWIDK